MTAFTRYLVLFVSFSVVGLLGLVVYVTVTHQTGYDDRQRMLQKCHSRGLDMMQNYNDAWVCVRTEKP